MTRYIIVTSSHADSLAKKVCECIDKGYTPTGGVAVAVYAAYAIYYQAMIQTKGEN